MTWQVAVPAALGAAGCAATASALQHHSNRSAPEAKALRAGELARFARAVVAHRLWQVALPIQLGGLVLHALALGNGALAAVQPLLIAGVVFALPLNRLLGRERITGREIGWAVALVVGLAGFLLAAAITPTSAMAGGSGSTLGVVAAGATTVVACCLLASRHATAAPAAAVLGVAAGIAYSAQALFLQVSTDLLPRGPTALVTSGAVYGLLVFGAAGFVLTQLAFRAGPLAASLPAITVSNPLGGVLLGMLVNGEQLRSSPAALAVETLGLTVLITAAIALGRTRHHSSAAPPHPSEIDR